MSVDKIDNTMYIEATLENNIDLAIRLMLEDIHREAEPVTPWKTGTLRTMVQKTMDGPHRGSIVWHAPYAIYQEKGRTGLGDYETSGTHIPFNHYTTPGTTSGFAIESVKKVVGRSRDYFVQAGAIR